VDSISLYASQFVSLCLWHLLLQNSKNIKLGGGEGERLEEFLERDSYVDIKNRSLMISGILELFIILPSVQTDWCWELGSRLQQALDLLFCFKTFSILNSLETTVGY